MKKTQVFMVEKNFEKFRRWTTPMSTRGVIVSLVLGTPTNYKLFYETLRIPIFKLIPIIRKFVKYISICYVTSYVIST